MAGLFFSKYYEGNSGTNKALQIYNSQNSSIDLQNDNGYKYYIKNQANTNTNWDLYHTQT